MIMIKDKIILRIIDDLSQNILAVDFLKKNIEIRSYHFFQQFMDNTLSLLTIEMYSLLCNLPFYYKELTPEEINICRGFEVAF